jgi:hypothetical protein
MGFDATSGNGILQDTTMKLKPKFCWLNSKGRKGQKMEEVAGNSRLFRYGQNSSKARSGEISPKSK